MYNTIEMLINLSCEFVLGDNARQQIFEIMVTTFSLGQPSMYTRPIVSFWIGSGDISKVELVIDWPLNCFCTGDGGRNIIERDDRYSMHNFDRESLLFDSSLLADHRLTIDTIVAKTLPVSKGN
jgi:hypothetical protein